MGGELRPEIQATLFASDAVPAGAQPWDASVTTTHATYMVNHFAFGTGYSYGDPTTPVGAAAASARAKKAEQLLGYRIRATSVAVTTGGVVTAGLQNDGVAPFYYELRLKVASMVVGCDSVHGELVLPDRILLGEANAVKASVTLAAGGQEAPNLLSCLSKLSVSLICPRCYAERPVLLANRGVDVATGKLVLAFGESAPPSAPLSPSPPLPPPSPSPPPPTTDTVGGGNITGADVSSAHLRTTLLAYTPALAWIAAALIAF